jgi:1,2-diacylglycerol 3-beta-galactosyltransferase
MVGPQIDLIYFDAGGGHRSAVQSLEASMRENWKVNLINLRDIAGDADFIKKWTGLSLEDFYNKTMALDYGHWVASTPGLWILQKLVSTVFNQIMAKAIEYWKQTNPNIIVSCIPHFNRPLFKAASNLNIPYVTIVTDMADCGQHFWLENQDQYVIVGNDLTSKQAWYILPDKEKIFRVDGQIVHPIFFENFRRPRLKSLKRGIVCFGSCGSDKMLTLAEKLCSNSQIRMIKTLFVCGKNQELENQLRILFKGIPNTDVRGFLSQRELAHEMQNSDFLIGKPGPGITNEALVCGIPVLLDSTHPMIQERYSLAWIEAEEFGMGGNITDLEVLRNFLLYSSTFKENIYHCYKNNAVFEVPKILKEILCTYSRKKIL